MDMYVFVYYLFSPTRCKLPVARTLPIQITATPPVSITMPVTYHCSKPSCIPASASFWPQGIPERAKGGSFPFHCVPQLCLQRAVVRGQRSPSDSTVLGIVGQEENHWQEMGSAVVTPARLA